MKKIKYKFGDLVKSIDSFSYLGIIIGMTKSNDYADYIVGLVKQNPNKLPLPYSYLSRDFEKNWEIISKKHFDILPELSRADFYNHESLDLLNLKDKTLFNFNFELNY